MNGSPAPTRPYPWRARKRAQQACAPRYGFTRKRYPLSDRKRRSAAPAECARGPRPGARQRPRRRPDGERDSVSGNQELVVGELQIGVHGTARGGVGTEPCGEHRSPLQVMRKTHVVELMGGGIEASGEPASDPAASAGTAAAASIEETVGNPVCEGGRSSHTAAPRSTKRCSRSCSGARRRRAHERHWSETIRRAVNTAS